MFSDLQGTQRAVVVSSEEVIRDVLIHKQDHFSDRPPSVRADLIMGGHGVGFADDSVQWRYKKKHMMRAMKDSGGIKDLETVTLKFGMEMIQEVELNIGEAFNPYENFRLMIGSIMMALIYGHSTQDDVQRIRKLDNRISAAMRPSGPNELLDICPSLRFLSTELRARYDEAYNIGKSFEKLCGSFIKFRQANRKMHKSKTIIDHFLNLLENSSDQNIDRNIILNEKNVLFMGVDLLVAGLESNSFFLTNLLGILVNHQEIQDQSYDEIIKAIGKRAATIDDRQQIPFIEALILETLRYTTKTPLSLPHYSKCDSELGGFFIPKGTIIFPNLWSLLHNEKHWDNPFEFNPLRFLEDGKLLPLDHIRRQRLLPFSAGRRQCPSEVFARKSLFILVTLLLQRFKFLPAEGHPLPQHDPREYTADIDNCIKPYHLIAQTRD